MAYRRADLWVFAVSRARAVIAVHRADVEHGDGAVSPLGRPSADRFNQRPRLESIGNVPPAELEMQYFHQHSAQAMPACRNANNLR